MNVAFLNKDEVRHPETCEVLLLANACYDMADIESVSLELGIDNLKGTLLFPQSSWTIENICNKLENEA